MVAAVTARFLRFSCDHMLFQDKYSRSNRARGTKVVYFVIAHKLDGDMTDESMCVD